MQLRCALICRNGQHTSAAQVIVYASMSCAKMMSCDNTASRDSRIRAIHMSNVDGYVPASRSVIAQARHGVYIQLSVAKNYEANVMIRQSSNGLRHRTTLLWRYNQYVGTGAIISRHYVEVDAT